MTTPSPTARLAAILCVSDRIPDPAEAEEVGREVLAERGAEYRASREKQAAAILRTIGAVAPSAELVAAVREAEAADADAGWWGLRNPENHDDFICNGSRKPYDKPYRWPSRDAALKAAAKTEPWNDFEPFLIGRRTTAAASEKALIALGRHVAEQLK